MASSLYKAQFALKLCSDHNNKELHAYCKSCTKKICSSCIKEEHNSHDWEMITDILREKRRSVPNECEEIRTKQLPGLRKEIDLFDIKIEEVDTKLEQNKFILNDSRQSYIDKINQIFDDRIDECQQKSEAARQIYKDMRDGLKQKVEYLEMMTTSLHKDINTLPDHDILDMEKEMKDELEKALSFNADKYTVNTMFVPGHIDVRALENMIGEVQCVSVDERNDIDRYSEIVMSLKPVSNTKAWVLVGNDSFPNMIDIEGEEPKTINTPVVDYVISTRGQFILSHENDGTILVLSQNRDQIRTINTKPLYPTWMSKTEKDDILVSLTDDGDDYNLVPTSRRIVQRMTLKGKVLNTYEYKEDGKTMLFTAPVRNVENKNSDVCVINRHNQDSGELIVLMKDGHVKFTYGGDGLGSEMFLPYGVECDSKCHILLSEKYSKAIHMLSAEGMFLCTLYQHRLRPFVISLHGSCLWCGFVEGRVKVFKYEN